MSHLSERLQERAINSPCPLNGCRHATLADLAIGEVGKVCGVCDPSRPDAARRFFDLGFIPGTPVVKRRTDVSRNTVIVEIGGYEMALRTAQAECITITARA